MPMLGVHKLLNFVPAAKDAASTGQPTRCFGSPLVKALCEGITMELLQGILDFLKDSWITYVLAVVGFVVGLAKFLDAAKKIQGHWHDLKAKLSGRKIADQKLKDESEKVAREIISLVSDRQSKEPQFDFNDFHNSADKSSRHSQETQNIYAIEFAAKVHDLRDEFLKRELKNKDVDMFHQNPTNHLGLRALAVGMATLSEKVKIT